MIEKDLKVIEEQAKIRWQDNWNFRAYLKQNVPSDVIDSAVFGLQAEVSKQIDCLSCANCCRNIQPHLTDEDVIRVATGLKTTATDFSAKYLVPDEFGEHVFAVKPCPMLAGPKCQVYEARPSDCASYPHLHEPDFLDYSISTIENYRVCPIVYNVYESLKTVFPYKPEVDYMGDEEQEA